MKIDKGVLKKDGLLADDMIHEWKAISKFWEVQGKRRLLLDLTEELAGNAHVTFEGDLQRLALTLSKPQPMFRRPMNSGIMHPSDFGNDYV